jgi:hypothetical protein
MKGLEHAVDWAKGIIKGFQKQETVHQATAW